MVLRVGGRSEQQDRAHRRLGQDRNRFQLHSVTVRVNKHDIRPLPRCDRNSLGGAIRLSHRFQPFPILQ